MEPAITHLEVKKNASIAAAPLGERFGSPMMIGNGDVTKSMRKKEKRLQQKTLRRNIKNSL